MIDDQNSEQNTLPKIEREQNQELWLREISQRTPSNDATNLPLAWTTVGVGGIFLFTITALLLRRLVALGRKQEHLLHWELQSQIPCSNCRFLNRSTYLKCAVHPSKAMQKEAIGCGDYWPKDSDKFLQ